MKSTRTASDIQIAELSGHKWYWSYHSYDNSTGKIIWFAKLAHAPEEGIGFTGWKGTVSETKWMTQDEINKVKNTGEFITFCPYYSQSCEAIIEATITALKLGEINVDRWQHAIEKIAGNNRFKQININAAQRVEAFLFAIWPK